MSAGLVKFKGCNTLASESQTDIPLQHTPLLALHQELGARMTGFGGWNMPVQYAGITAEHQTVRQQAGMFDISHMGKFALRGVNLRSQLQKLVPSNLSILSPGAAKYSVFLTPEAGILDDLIFYYQGETTQGEETGILIVNASTASQDKAWLLEHLDTQVIDFQDWTADKVLIAVQGPQAVAILQSIVDLDLHSIKNYGHAEGKILGHPAWFARTGYTGEDGFEIMVDAANGEPLWRSLLSLGIAPCGLGARDTLRLEAAMALYGQDIDLTTTPWEAGLGWLVNQTGDDFIGATALAAQKQAGVPRQLVGLQMQGRNIARHGYTVLYEDAVVGEVTSGTLSPTIGKAIALAYVPTHLSNLGQELMVNIREKPYPATVVPRPFYRRPKPAS
jgi:aminomethyltransferase